MPKNKRIGLVCLAALVIIISITAYALVNRSSYEVLYFGLSPSEAGEVYQQLVNKGVDVKTEGTGTIKVPAGMADQLRMTLAADGYPKSGLTYDIYMNNTGLGVTEYDKENYLRFQLEDRLQKTIMTMDGVDQAVVTLTIPKQETFVLESQKVEPSASVMLGLKYGVNMTDRQIIGIEELVAKAVAGLKVENVSIVDQNMNVLKANKEEEGDMTAIGTRLEFEKQMRDQLEGQIKTLLKPVFGEKNVAVAVSLVMDYDKELTESVEFAPVIDDKGIEKDLSELTEFVQNANGSEGEGSGAPGYVIGGTDSNGAYQKKSTQVNYLVNEIRKQIEKTQGTIADLSVSVVINKEGSNAQTQMQVQDIVAKAIGVNPEMVVVEYLSFAKVENPNNPNLPTKPGAQGAIPTYIVMGLAGLVTLLIIILVLVLAKGRKKNKAQGEQYELESQARQLEAIEAKERKQNESILGEESADKGLTWAGKKAQQPLITADLEEIVSNEPEVTVKLIRTWMTE